VNKQRNELKGNTNRRMKLRLSGYERGNKKKYGNPEK
jgi:hypothetical protein